MIWFRADKIYKKKHILYLKLM